MAYNYAHDVALPGSSERPLVYFMYPQAETSEGRVDPFDPDNFNGHAQDIFGSVRSINMLCIPAERGTVVELAKGARITRLAFEGEWHGN